MPRRSLLALAGVLWTGAVVIWALRNMDGSDYHAYHAAAQAMLAGGEPWATGGYLYPLPFLLLVAPLTVLPLEAASFVWVLAQGALFVPTVWLLWRCVAPERRLVAAVGVPLLVVARPVEDTLAHGNANLLVLFLLLVALTGLVRHRPGLGGGALAVAVAAKATPAALLPALVLARRWRALAVSLGMLGFLAALPALLVGPGRLVALHQAFLGVVVGSSGAAASRALRPQNQGVSAVLSRLSGEVLPVWLPWVLAAVLLGGSCLVLWRRRVGLLGSFCTLVALIPLLAPIAWVHHQALCLLPLALLWRSARSERGDRFALGVIVFFGIAQLSTIRDIVGAPVAGFLLEHGALTVAALAVWAATLRAAEGHRSRA